jgi:hypothetical protein
MMRSALLATTAPMPITLLNWRPLAKGALRGFATVQLDRSLKITDISVLSSNGKLWTSFPGRPLVSEGRALVDDRGKQRFSTIIEWTDKAAADRFSAAIIAAIRAEYPEALEPSA